MGHRWDGWTEETIERCKEMWFEHIPASKIGEEIGATRNMVIAKMNRLGFRKSNVFAIQAGEEIPNLTLTPNTNGHPVEASVEASVLLEETVAEATVTEETVVEAISSEEASSTSTPDDIPAVETPKVETPTAVPVAEETAVIAVSPEPVVDAPAIVETVETITASDDAEDQHVMDEALADVTSALVEALSPPEEAIAEPSSESDAPEPVPSEEPPVAVDPPAPSTTAPQAPAKVTCEGVSFFDIREGQCKFPLWDFNNTTPIHEKRFCGCTRVGTTSWCAKHLRVVADPIRRGPRPMRAR